jgi:hypothetical protein
MLPGSDDPEGGTMQDNNAPVYRTWDDAVRAQRERIAARRAEVLLAVDPCPDTIPEGWDTDAE